MDVLLYLNAVRKHWWPLMSCALFTLLGMWILYADKSNAWALRSTFGIAAFCSFFAGYRAWSEERDKRVHLENSLQKPLSLKERTGNISTAVLEFLYERAAKKPTIPMGGFMIGVESAADWMQRAQENQILASYERDTLGIYDFRFRRDVAGSLNAFRKKGLNTDRLEGLANALSNEIDPEYKGLSIVIDEWIKAVGKELASLADQVESD